jgi:hypothetical protein
MPATWSTSLGLWSYLALPYLTIPYHTVVLVEINPVEFGGALVAVTGGGDL